MSAAKLAQREKQVDCRTLHTRRPRVDPNVELSGHATGSRAEPSKYSEDTATGNVVLVISESCTT